MKQKAVIKVSMNSQKCRSKALKIVVGVDGVESVALKGDDKRQLEVVGDGFDTVEITRKLRKNVGYAEIVSVEEKKEEKKEEEKKKDEPTLVWYGGGVPAPTYYYYDDSCRSRADPSCSIM